MEKEKLHIIPHNHQVNREDRRRLQEHNSFVIWFTGLSGSGKSTLASELEKRLYERGLRTFILDGDNRLTSDNVTRASNAIIFLNTNQQQV